MILFYKYYDLGSKELFEKGGEWDTLRKFNECSWIVLSAYKIIFDIHVFFLQYHSNNSSSTREKVEIIHENFLLKNFWILHLEFFRQILFYCVKRRLKLPEVNMNVPFERLFHSLVCMILTYRFLSYYFYMTLLFLDCNDYFPLKMFQN